jgi:hypothetical protein
MTLRSMGRAAAMAFLVLLSSCDWSDDPVDTAPVADAGGSAGLNGSSATQSALVGTPATLDASASTDADGQPLSFRWTLASAPSGSAAALARAATVKPSFTPDVAGRYVFTLVVNDGELDSAPATLTVTAAVQNVAPVANAGSTQNVFTGTRVTLDGSDSTDANSDALTYAWTLNSAPSGSTATLSSAAAVKPTFVADLAGSYVFTLVVNDGTVDSAPATVTVTAAVQNVAPVAQAGTAQSVTVGTVVSLDGTASTDANGDTLTYAWTLTRPSGSTATLTGASSATPGLTPDIAGTYTASLIVNDGQLASAPATVTITAAVADVAPVANAGSAQTAQLGSTVTLNGSASSDANGDALTYTWSFTSVPVGSTAALSAAHVVAPTFTPDTGGTYVAQLIVNDGQLNSVPVTVTIGVVNNLVVNGSFEAGLSSWLQGTQVEPSAAGTCSFNAATAPGTETLTGFPGFAATDGTQIVLGSVTSTPSAGRFSCVLYQDVAIPGGTSTLTLSYDAVVADGNDGCAHAGAFAGLFSTSSIPGVATPPAGTGNLTSCITVSGSSLIHATKALTVTGLPGTTVRLAFLNVALASGHEVIGIDNVKLIAVP